MKREMTVSAHGVSYVIVADDEGLIGRKIAGGKPYESELLEHIYDQSYEGVALDIGAHIGNHSLWMAHVCDLQVVAYEADPDVRRELQDNVDRNWPALGGGEIEVEQFALGARTATADVAPQGRLSIRDDVYGPVVIAALDDLTGAGSGGTSRPISVIKIDVEDMEPQVISGGKKTILEHRPDVYAEARDDLAHDLLASELVPLEYKMSTRFSSRSVATPVEKWVPA